MNTSISELSLMTEQEKRLRTCERIIEMYESNADFKNAMYWMALEIYYGEKQL